MQLVREFGVTDYPAPAGGCLLTDIGFSNRLRDLMMVQKTFEKRELFYLKNGRHFRLDNKTKIIVGRSIHDNKHLLKHFDSQKDILIKHATLASPDVILTGDKNSKNIQTAAMICASYTKAKSGEISGIHIIDDNNRQTIQVDTVKSEAYKGLMI